MPRLLPSYDPRIFGPPTWECLHILAQNYPVKADERTRRACGRFLFCLSRLLPCEHCGKHFRRFLRGRDVQRASSGRAALVALLVDAHNAVNAHTRPGAPAFSYERAEAQYIYMPLKNCPAGPRLWTQNKVQ
jgi:hypothetical protein